MTLTRTLPITLQFPDASISNRTSFVAAREILGRAANPTGRQRDQSAHSAVEYLALGC